MAKRSDKLESLIEVLDEQHKDYKVNDAYNFLRICGLMHKLFDVNYRKTGLNRTQIMILSFILANGGTVTPSELLNKVDRSDNAISKSLDNLDKLGLTKSTRTKTDRRYRRVALTEQGLDKLKEILPIRRRLFRRAFKPLTREEGEQLDLILQKILNHLLLVVYKKA